MAVTGPSKPFKNPVCCTNAFGRIFSAVDGIVYFSQVILRPDDVGRCYQNNDPTSTEFPDLLDSDGGVIHIEEARRIKALAPFRSGILAFATNGVWYVSNPDGGFKATAFNVEKITERGIDSVKSIIEAENEIYYFSNNGIMRLASNEFNKLEVSDISETTIKGHYTALIAGQGFHGVYDEFAQQCVWWSPTTTSRGLIYDIRLQAFYPQLNASEVRISSPFSIVNASYWVSLKNNVTSFDYSFAAATRKSFADFGVDQEAYLITGPETLGKFANKKAVKQAKVFFRKTETQIVTSIAGQYIFDKPSGCLFQARWDYDISDAYGKFVGKTGVSGTGKEMQLYNPMKRGFIPNTFPYTLDTGEGVISKKFNIRGNGDAVQFVFKAQTGKDMQLLGYSINYTMRGRM